MLPVAEPLYRRLLLVALILGVAGGSATISSLVTPRRSRGPGNGGGSRSCRAGPSW